MKVKDIRHIRFVNTLLASALLCTSLQLGATAQVRPVNDYGALGLARLLKELNTTASVMMLGAHPDDENSPLIAFFARGENARTAYLSLTRGDGGQNIIGPELFESLGIIRSEELLQARRLDGAEQYFARAFDYGFSKMLAEAKQKWDEKVVLCDVVRAIRMFRPLVLHSGFTGKPGDGHGHHQYSGYLAPIAVKAAADPKECTQSGPPWQVLKFYTGGSQPTLRINAGRFDTLLGRSYTEIAIEGRSQHKSQGQGGIEVHGDQFAGLNLIESKVPKNEKETSVFDSIDTSISGIPKLVGTPIPEIAPDLEIVQRSAETALREFRPTDPQKIAPALLNGLKATRIVRAKLVNIKKGGSDSASNADLYLARKDREFSLALAAVYGVVADALADKETVVPGDDLSMSVKVFFPQNPPSR